MEFLKNLVRKINSNIIARNLVWAACGIILLVFTANILLKIFTRHGQIKKVPDLSGMTVEEATRAGKSASLRIEINDSLYVPAYPGGIILEQSPSANSEVKSGRRVFVTINSFKQKTAVIPYVTGYSLRQAKNILEMAGFGIDQLVYQSDLATNNVIGQQFDGQTIRQGSKLEAEIGSGVSLLVGRGSDATPQAIPRVVGFTAREAKSRLWEAGFNVGKITYDEGVNLLNEKEARVSVQTPGVGVRREYGSSVDFTLSMSEDKIKSGLKKSDREASKATKELADSLARQEQEKAAAKEAPPTE